MKNLTYIFGLLILISCQNQVKSNIEIKGELKQWHKVTLVIPGPKTSEWAKENPFLDYKLEVTFSNGDEIYTVPGFYAADGNAAETSTDAGNIWEVRFRPDKTGTWNYKISFRKGKDIAIKDKESDGVPVNIDGGKGSFKIVESDKKGSDFRAKGRIINGEKGYFQFQGTGDIWIKNGADSPENFLAYADFDQTSRFSLKSDVREGEADPKKGLHTYNPHIKDWKAGDPTWQNGKGKGIIGALNYLASVNVNSVYMLTMNILGDGKDVWPYTDHNERYRFDCSKLDQWEVIFDHMDQLGIMIHFVLQETENECLLDEGFTDVQRKLYLRELVARFGHHLGVTWNIGEENGPAKWSPIGQTDEQRKDMIAYLKQVNPYPSNVVLHTHSNDKKQDEFLTPLLGFKYLDGPSMQIGNPANVHQRIKKWVKESEAAGKRWLVNLDEIGPAWKGVMPDSFDANHDTVRSECLWSTLLAGGAGVEWYCGYRYPHNDLNLEDFRSRDRWWKQSALATRFVKDFPLDKMRSCDELINIDGAYCFAQPDTLYLIYLPKGSEKATLDLLCNKSFSVKWFNPRKFEELQEGSISNLQGAGSKFIGRPPGNDDNDWVVVVQ